RRRALLLDQAADRPHPGRRRRAGGGLLLAQPGAGRQLAAAASVGRPGRPRTAGPGAGGAGPNPARTRPAPPDEQFFRFWRQQCQPDYWRQRMTRWTPAELLPHAGDMILLDAVERFDDDSLHARLTVTPGGLFNQ